MNQQMTIDQQKRQALVEREERRKILARRQREKSKRSGKWLVPEKPVSIKRQFLHLDQEVEEDYDGDLEDFEEGQDLGQVSSSLSVLIKNKTVCNSSQFHNANLEKGAVPIILNGCYGGFGLSEKACSILKECKHNENSNEWHFRKHSQRTDPDLVNVVLCLGRAADGYNASLEIQYIPREHYLADAYSITEYDGIESLVLHDEKVQLVKANAELAKVKAELADTKTRLENALEQIVILDRDNFFMKVFFNTNNKTQ
jgi:hypothetical protein